MALHDLVQRVVDALDPDRQRAGAAAARRPATSRPTSRSPTAAQALLDEAVEPLADQARAARAAGRRAAQSYEQVIDETRKDKVHRRRLLARRDRPGPRDGRVVPRSSSTSTRTRSPRLQILYSRPYATAAHVQGRSRNWPSAIGRPPHRWTPEALWEAYETLDRSKVHGSAGTRAHQPRLARALRAGARRASSCPTPTRSTSASRLAAPAGERRPHVHGRAARVAASASATTSPRSLRSAPTTSNTRRSPSRAGSGRRHEVFGDELTPLLDELNEALVA